MKKHTLQNTIRLDMGYQTVIRVMDWSSVLAFPLAL